MSARLDLKGLVIGVELLEEAHPARKLDTLRYLALHNGGRLDLPSPAGDYDPLIKSVELFGVYAMSDVAEELPKNWVKAATNILLADECDNPAPSQSPDQFEATPHAIT